MNPQDNQFGQQMPQAQQEPQILMPDQGAAQAQNVAGMQSAENGGFYGGQGERNIPYPANDFGGNEPGFGAPAFGGQDVNAQVFGAQVYGGQDGYAGQMGQMNQMGQAGAGQQMTAADIAAMQGGGQMQGGMQQQMPGQQMPAQGQPGVEVQKDEPTSTQATLLISELRDNVVIMKDGSFRAVVACKSINFDLMSEMEREGVEYSYQNFLNSLEFTTQILIRSQRVDIGPYIERLNDIRRNNDNMLLGVLMDDYINFIDILSQEANIMDKSFFVVVPYYTSAEDEKELQQTKNFFKVFTRAKGTEVTRIDRETYDKALTEITNRVDSVISGLFQIGINSVRLNTKQLAELYYNFNNPDTAVREPLVDFGKLATMYVRKGEKNEQEK